MAHQLGGAAMVTIAQVKRAASEHYKIPIERLFSKVRTRDVLVPRQSAMYIATQAKCGSLTQIGRDMGGFDHTTVMGANRRIQMLYQTDPDIRFALAEIRKRLDAFILGTTPEFVSKERTA